MFSDQFSRVIETMRPAANMIPLVASDDASHPLFTDTSAPPPPRPAIMRTPRELLRFFSTVCESKKELRPVAII